MKTLLIILLFCIPIAAQQTNVHVGAVVGASGNGFDAPILGAGGGVDIRKSRLVFSLDADALRAHKTLYKNGTQYDATETLRFYLNKVFVQAGAVEQRNKFGTFAPVITIEPLVGIGIQPDKRYILGVNFRDDISSSHHQRVIQGFMQFWGSHHLYFKVSGALSNFKECAGCKRTTAGSVKAEVGFYF